MSPFTVEMQLEGGKLGRKAVGVFELQRGAGSSDLDVETILARFAFDRGDEQSLGVLLYHVNREQGRGRQHDLGGFGMWQKGPYFPPRRGACFLDPVRAQDLEGVPVIPAH